MKKFTSILYCTLFFGICTFFSVFLLLPQTILPRENNGSLPELFDENGINHDFGNEYEDWFSKNFAFRDSIVDLFSLLKIHLFAEGNDQVIVGKEDFLFFDDTTADYLGTSAMTEEEILSAAKALQILQERTQASGAEFLFVCAPNKNTIYGEKMPERYRESDAPSNMDRLYAELDSLKVPYLDCRPVLRKAAETALVYHKRDTHWNGLGAEHTFAELLNRFQLSLPDLSGRGPVLTDTFEGDLDALLFPNKIRYDQDSVYDFTGLYVFTSAYSTPMDLVITARGGGRGKLLIFRDSFANAWLPYAAASFAEIHMERVTPYRTEFIESWQPDYVVVEIAERNLPSLAAALGAGESMINPG